MNLQSWHVSECWIQVQEGVDDSGAPVWGTQIPLTCRTEVHAMVKEKFQRSEREGLTRLSIDHELKRDDVVKVWLAKDDPSEASEGHEATNIFSVYDKWERFVHTVLVV